MTTAKLKRKPQLSKFESCKAANTKEVQFRLKFFVVLLIDTYPAAAARRSGRTCRLQSVHVKTKIKTKIHVQKEA